MLMYEFKNCLNFIYTRSHSSVGCLFALSCLHFKFDFVWSIMVTSYFLRHCGSGDQFRYLN